MTSENKDFHVYIKSTNLHLYVTGYNLLIELGVPEKDLPDPSIRMYRYTTGDFTITEVLQRENK